MNEFWKTTIGILGILFGVLLVAFTGYETFAFLHSVTGNVVVSVIGLIMFEGGFLYWAAVFKVAAEGLLQMAISLLGSLADIALVVMSVGIQLGAFDVSVIDPSFPSKVVIAAVIGNLLLKYFYSLSDPEVMKNIWGRSLQGLMLFKTFASLQTQVEDMATELAGDMAKSWYNQFHRDFFNQHEALTQRRPKQLPAPVRRPERKKKRPWLSSLFGNGNGDGETAVPVGEPDGEHVGRPVVEPEPVGDGLTVDEVMGHFDNNRLSSEERELHRTAVRLFLGGASRQAVEMALVRRAGHIPRVGVLQIIKDVDDTIKRILRAKNLQNEVDEANRKVNSHAEPDPK